MKIFCVGRNYVAHAKELNNEVPDEPIIFMKPKSALLQAHTPFYYPEFTNELHYECELVLRISKNGKYIQERFASKYYDAVTAGVRPASAWLYCSALKQASTCLSAMAGSRRAC